MQQTHDGLLPVEGILQGVLEHYDLLVERINLLLQVYCADTHAVVIRASLPACHLIRHVLEHLLVKMRGCLLIALGADRGILMT